MIDFTDIEGFDWDEGNINKNWDAHQVSHIEAEQVFFNDPLLIASDEKHSAAEVRYFALGKTDFGRLLFVVFTTRKHLIRVISARDMSKKERKAYREEA